jgi:hypothetical protein
MAVKLFGFELKRTPEIDQSTPAIAIPQNDDGAITITSGGYFGTYLDLESSYKNENDLISRYREMAMQPELDAAIDDIVNESIVHDKTGKSINLLMDDLKVPNKIKQLIKDEFDNVLRILNFSNEGQDIFKRWYIDGRLFYQVIIDEKNPQLGIQNLLYLDPRKIKKVRSIIKEKDPRTGIELIKGYQEFYTYNEKASSSGTMIVTSPTDTSIKIASDSIVSINSGIMDARRQLVLSHLHKAIKPLNQLRMLEDATVIYRISRAPERRVFYIDVGNLPKTKADQYLRDIMTKFRNKVVYDSATGEIKDDRKYMSMMEDFWIPRRGEGKSTEITTLPPGQNLGELSDVRYFEQKLYRSLNVPITRLEQNQGFMLGRAAEITRDELKFTKFIEKLRARFSTMFDELLERQLALKGICSVDEWKEMKEFIHYDFLKDNNFTELKEAELTSNRLQTLNLIEPYVGIYFSKEWVKKHVLQMNTMEIDQMQGEIEQEIANMTPIEQMRMSVKMGISPEMTNQAAPSKTNTND